MNSYRSRNGFTLIEVMIAVAIVAILAVVAFPSYRDSMLKARRAEGRAAIMRTMQAQERYYTANNVYIQSSDSAFLTTSGFSLYSSDNPAKAAYTIAATFSTTACGVLTAANQNQCVIVTANAVQADPLCGTMSMNSAGGRSSTASSSSTATSGCW